MAGHLFKIKNFLALFSIFLISLSIIGCASSNVSRDAATNVDMGMDNARNMWDGLSDGSIGDTYQNTSQSTKGGILGGIAGAVTGSVSSLGLAPMTAAGIILGASYGAYIDVNSTFRDKLLNRGVNIIELGDQIMIVMPSARIFQALTPTIKPQSYETLQMVSTFINRYTKTLVKISAHTNLSNSPTADYALSAQQATAIERFLVDSGVDARMLYAEGYGGTHLVQKNDNSWFGNDNYRIEITFEKLYV